MMKNKTIKIVKVFNVLAGILFISSIYLSIKWSTIPVIDIAMFNNRFWVNDGNVDAALLNLVTGYFTGYIVYLLTVVIPTLYRSGIIMKAA
jgi:hypothetical protein